MTIGVFTDFRNDKFIYLYKEILKKNKLVFIGQKKYILSIKKKIVNKNAKYFIFNSIVSNNLNINQNSALSFIINFFIILKNFCYSYYFLHSNNIKTLLVSDDRSPDILLWLIKLSKKNNIKVILIPSGIFSGKKFVIQNRLKNFKSFSSHNPITNKKNIYTKFKGRYVYFYKKSILRLYNFFNLYPLNPWISGTNVDEIFFQSEASKEYYIKQGIENKLIKNIKLTNFKTDLLEIINIKRKFYKKYKIKSNKKLIIFQPMTWYEHNITTYEEHYKRNFEVAKIIYKSNENKKFTCLISLHPKQKKKDYIWLEKNFKFKIIDEKLFDVITLANLFIISYESDTMLWSADLKIPCIITNFFKEKSNEFNLNYLYFCNKKNSFKKQITNLIFKKKVFKNIDEYKKKQILIADAITDYE
ncbi:hypothetical protein OAY13_00585 [Candidatus Pelagibacter sp.]|nr:hypothetical protein [Candidatus Pelagibacter sp.]